MAEHPILFNGEMVRAILAGRKTQTRRIVKDAVVRLPLSQQPFLAECPFGIPGDRLWVRETFYAWRCKVYTSKGMFEGPEECVYAADGGTLLNGAKWKPSIHMFHRLSRITLDIVDVRVQRLQDLTEEDAEEEGIDTWHDFPNHRNYPDGGCNCGDFPSSDRFSWLWDSIYAMRGQGWNTNPWIWAVSFKVVRP